MSEILVIGLDGTTWGMIKPLAEEGKLPIKIKKLMDNLSIWTKVI